MGKSIEVAMFAQIAAAVIVAFAPIQAEQLVGRWEGVIALPDDQFMPVAIRIARDAGGKVTGLADSPTQGDMDRPVTELTLEQGVVRFRLKDVEGQYEGRLSGETITGAWRMEEASYSLDLTRKPA